MQIQIYVCGIVGGASFEHIQPPLISFTSFVTLRVEEMPLVIHILVEEY